MTRESMPHVQDARAEHAEFFRASARHQRLSDWSWRLHFTVVALMVAHLTLAALYFCRLVPPLAPIVSSLACLGAFWVRVLVHTGARHARHELEQLGRSLFR